MSQILLTPMHYLPYVGIQKIRGQILASFSSPFLSATAYRAEGLAVSAL